MKQDREGPNGLPHGWQLTTLEELVLSPKSDIVDGPFGSDLKATEYREEGVPIIRLQNIDRNRFVEKNIRFISNEKAQKLQRHEFVGGDIVVTKLGEPLGKACVVPSNLKRGIIVADVVRIRIDERFVLKSYLVYAINSDAAIKQLEKMTKGTTRQRVNLGHIRQLRIPVAPLAQQHAVVSEIEKQFTRLDAAVAALKRIQANLRRYRTSVLKTAGEGHLVPTEAELARREGRDYELADRLLTRILKDRRAKWEADQLARMKAAGRPPKDDKWGAKYEEPAAPDTAPLPNLPNGWHWVTLSQLSWHAAYGSSEKCGRDFPGPPVLRIPNVEKGRVDLSDLKRAAYTTKLNPADALSPGDFLVIRTNGSRDLIGRAALVRQEFDRQHFFASYLIRFRIVDVGSVAEWLNWLWDAPIMRESIELLAATSAGQYNISLSTLNGIAIPLPPSAEQRRIIAEIERRLSVIEELEGIVEANLKRAGRLSGAVLKRAFEGKLAPQDPNDEPARALLERIREERARLGVDRKIRKPSGRRRAQGAAVIGIPT